MRKQGSRSQTSRVENAHSLSCNAFIDVAQLHPCLNIHRGGLDLSPHSRYISDNIATVMSRTAS